MIVQNGLFVKQVKATANGCLSQNRKGRKGNLLLLEIKLNSMAFFARLASLREKFLLL
jgi:hypothetical protein